MLKTRVRECVGNAAGLRGGRARNSEKKQETTSREGRRRRPLDPLILTPFPPPLSSPPGIYASQTRDDFSDDDVGFYFEYMGMLAADGDYSRLDRMKSAGLAPVDLLLLMAAGEGDAPKVAEMLRAGAKTDVKVSWWLAGGVVGFFYRIFFNPPPPPLFFPQDVDGKTAWDLAADSPAVLDLLNDPQKAYSV